MLRGRHRHSGGDHSSPASRTHWRSVVADERWADRPALGERAMSSYIPLTHVDLLLASIFLVMNAVFSILLSLRLERQLIVSALRMVTQLFLVGLVLKAIFTLSSPWLTLLAAAVMVTFAGREIWARQDRRLRGIWGIGLGGTSMML